VPISSTVQVRPATTNAAPIATKPRRSINTNPVMMEPAVEPKILASGTYGICQYDHAGNDDDDHWRGSILQRVVKPREES
jgi:hypothetical protein